MVTSLCLQLIIYTTRGLIFQYAACRLQCACANGAYTVRTSTALRCMHARKKVANREKKSAFKFTSREDEICKSWKFVQYQHAELSLP